MREVGFCVGLAVERCRLYIFILLRVVLRNDLECIAIIERNLHLVEQGRTDDVVRKARRHGVESHSREDVEGRHSAAILVAADTHQIVTEPSLHKHTHTLLRLPRLACVAVEVGDVEARLVAHNVLADVAR